MSSGLWLEKKTSGIGGWKPIAWITALSHAPLMVVFGVVTMFCVATFNLVNLQTDKDVVGMDFQVAIKLLVTAAFGLYGAIGFATIANVRRVLLSFPGLWMVFLVGCYFVSCSAALFPTYAFASAVVLGLVLLGTVTAMAHLRTRLLLNTLFYSLAAFNIGSWLAFVFWPEVGVFAEPTTGGQFTTRMSGLAHPNTLGQFSGILLVLGTVLYVDYGYRSWFRKLILLSAALALVLCVSRTSLIATVLALAYMFRRQVFHPRWWATYLLLAMVGLVAMMASLAFVDWQDWIGDRLVLLTKSGDTSELTTATGRAEIWSKSLYLIMDGPLFGFGAASSKELLSEYSLYTHNLWLNVALSTGVLGATAVVAMTLSRLMGLFSRSFPLADGLLVMILVNGLFENVIFSLLAGLPTMVWIISLTWARFDQIQEVDCELEALS